MKKLLIVLLTGLSATFAYADTKISAMTSTTTLNSVDVIPVVTNPSTSPANRIITKSNLITTLGIPATTSYIQNTSSLQSGATFYVSSGTVSGQATIRSLLTGTSFYASYDSSGTIIPDATLGNNISIVLHSSATINVPSNAMDMQMFRYRVSQDTTGNRQVFLDNHFNFGVDVSTWIASTTGNKTDYLGCIYRVSTSSCDVVSGSLRGY